MFLCENLISPILIWILNQLQLINVFTESSHFLIKIFFKESSEVINFTIDSYFEDFFKSIFNTIVTLTIGLMIIPITNKKIPLIALSVFWILIQIIGTYLGLYLIKNSDMPLEMLGKRNFWVSLLFLISGKLLGCYITYWFYSFNEFLDPFSKKEKLKDA
jgi:hypothetical protein